MPTIRDVAREAGVSVASASRALNGLSNVTEEMRARVQEAARRLNFVPHSGARSLTRRRTDAIGVILPDLFGEYFSEVVRGIDRVAHQAGMQLLLGNMHGSAHETAVAIRAMRGRVDGLLVMPPEIEAAFLADNLPRDLPTVILNHHGEAVGFPSVAVDNHSGAYRMTEFLIQRGHKRIAHIAGPKHNLDAEERLRGFAHAMAELTGERAPLTLPGDFSEDAGVEAARILIASGMPVDAIFAANDMMAVGCMSTLMEAGIAVPDEVAVAGFDDIPLARFVEPPLTTMQVNMAHLGEAATKMLLTQMRGELDEDTERQVLIPELVHRRSAPRPFSPQADRTATEQSAAKD